MKILVFILVIAMLNIANHSVILAQQPEDQTTETTDITVVDVKETTAEKENLPKAGKDYLADIHQFRKSAGIKFTNNEKRIDEIKATILSMNVKVKSAVYQKKVSDLMQTNNKLKKELSNHRYDGADEWKAFKIEFNGNMDELSKALKDFTTNEKK